MSTSTLELSRTGGVNMLKSGTIIRGQKFTGRFVPEGYVVMDDDLSIIPATATRKKGRYTPAGQVPPGLGKKAKKLERLLSMQHGEDYNYGYEMKSHTTVSSAQEVVGGSMMTSKLQLVNHLGTKYENRKRHLWHPRTKWKK